MKAFKHMTAFVLALVMTAALAVTAYAATVTVKYRVYVYSDEITFRQYDYSQSTTPSITNLTISATSSLGSGSALYHVKYADGAVAYCIEPGVHSDDSGTYKEGSSASWYNLPASVQSGIALAMSLGYPSADYGAASGDRNSSAIINAEKWAATQAIIWELICEYRNAYTYDDWGYTMANDLSGKEVENAIMHILIIHYIRYLKERFPNSYLGVLSNMCFFVDGPLAINGTAAWIKSCIQKCIYDVNVELKMANMSPMMVIGLQKSGKLYDYIHLIGDSIRPNSIYCVTDDFRNNYVDFDKTPSSTTYGNETYYGQDFLLKTSSGKLFVFNAPYPFPNKDNIAVFKKEKANIEHYFNIGAYGNLVIVTINIDVDDNIRLVRFLHGITSLLLLAPKTEGTSRPPITRRYCSHIPYIRTSTNPTSQTACSVLPNTTSLTQLQRDISTY